MALTPALNLSSQRRLLQATVGGFLVGAMVFGALALRVGSSPHAVSAPPVGGAKEATASLANAATINPDHPAWERALRRPLYDPPPPPPPEPKPLPPLQSKLLGTIIEPGASQAMVSLPGGSVEFLKEGDALGPHDPGAVIETIEADRIRVARDGETTELTIDRGY